MHVSYNGRFGWVASQFLQNCPTSGTQDPSRITAALTWHAFQQPIRRLPTPTPDLVHKRCTFWNLALAHAPRLTPATLKGLSIPLISTRPARAGTLIPATMQEWTSLRTSLRPIWTSWASSTWFGSNVFSTCQIHVGSRWTIAGLSPRTTSITCTLLLPK